MVVKYDMIWIVLPTLRLGWPDRLKEYFNGIPCEVKYADECVSKEASLPVSRVVKGLSFTEVLDDIYRELSTSVPMRKGCATCHRARNAKRASHLRQD